MVSGTAFFIGVPGEDEGKLLNYLEESYHVHIFEQASDVYKYLALMFPHVVVFAKNQSDMQSLLFFRQLRRLERVCVIVCLEEKIEGFTGKNYLHRKRATKDEAGLQQILGWAKMIHIDAFERVLSTHNSMQPITAITTTSPPSTADNYTIGDALGNFFGLFRRLATVLGL
jgi:hypothetical protein